MDVMELLADLEKNLLREDEIALGAQLMSEMISSGTTEEEKAAWAEGCQIGTTGFLHVIQDWIAEKKDEAKALVTV